MREYHFQVDKLKVAVYAANGGDAKRFFALAANYVAKAYGLLDESGALPAGSRIVIGAQTYGETTFVPCKIQVPNLAKEDIGSWA